MGKASPLQSQLQTSSSLKRTINQILIDSKYFFQETSTKVTHLNRVTKKGQKE